MNESKKIQLQIANKEQIVDYKWESSHPGRKIFIAQHGLSTFDETSVKPHNVGHMTYTCSECGALMFKEEKSDKSVSNDRLSAKFFPVLFIWWHQASTN